MDADTLRDQLKSYFSPGTIVEIEVVYRVDVTKRVGFSGLSYGIQDELPDASRRIYLTPDSLAKWAKEVEEKLNAQNR